MEKLDLGYFQKPCVVVIEGAMSRIFAWCNSSRLVICRYGGTTTVWEGFRVGGTSVILWGAMNILTVLRPKRACHFFFRRQRIFVNIRALPQTKDKPFFPTNDDLVFPIHSRRWRRYVRGDGEHLHIF